MGNKRDNNQVPPARKSRRRQTYEQRPEVQQLLNTIDNMEFCDVIKKLDEYSVSMNKIKDRLFRYQIKIMDEKAPYNWSHSADKRLSDFMPPTLQHALDIPSIDEQIRISTLNSDVNRHVSELYNVKLRNPAYSAPIVTTVQYSQGQMTYVQALRLNANANQAVLTPSTAALGVNVSNPITSTTGSCDPVMNTGYAGLTGQNNHTYEMRENSDENRNKNTSKS